MSNKLTQHLHPGMRVFVPSMSNESVLLNQELSLQPESANGVNFHTVQFPGIDRMDYIALHPHAKQSGYFMTPGLRLGLQQNRANLFSLDYAGIKHHLLHGSAMDLAIAHISSPDADGWCSPGLSCDFMPLVWSRAQKRVAHINPLMPRLPSSFRIHVSELDDSVVSEQALLNFKDPSQGDVENRISEWVAPLIRDGDTIQFGIGSVPMGLAQALCNHRRLKFHGGLVSSALQKLWNAGAMDRQARIVAGVVLGDESFREFVKEIPNLWLTDVRHTHDTETISKIDGFVAINSAIEVDLLGQVNAERSAGNLQAGSGGLPVFASGALAANQGRLLICLPSTARKGTVSRITPVLGNDAVCTLPRYMADTVITEYGVASVRHLGPDARAKSLIDIAAPEHRASLEQAWLEIRQKL